MQSATTTASAFRLLRRSVPVLSPPRSRVASVVPRTRPAIAPSGEHQQRQNARHDGVGPVAEADQLQDQQGGDKAHDRANHPAGDLQRIFHVFLDDQSQQTAIKAARFCRGGPAIRSPLSRLNVIFRMHLARLRRVWRHQCPLMISGTFPAGGVLRLRWVRMMPSMMVMPMPGRSPSCTLSRMLLPGEC